MANTKRKDKSRKVLRKGESQRPDGTYQFRWTDENRKRHCIYARNLDDLRYKEDEIDKDKKDGIKAEARYTSLNDMYELWRDLKRGIKNNTFENYKYMYETFVRNQIGSQFIMSIKKFTLYPMQPAVKYAHRFKFFFGRRLSPCCIVLLSDTKNYAKLKKRKILPRPKGGIP